MIQDNYMPPNSPNFQQGSSVHKPKPTIGKKVGLTILGLLLVGFVFLSLTGGYGWIIVAEVVGIPFRKLTEMKYHSPKVEEHAIVNHIMGNPQSHPKGPYIVFTEEFVTPYYEDYGGAKTGLFNVESKETTILAPENTLPKNSTMFSADGKYLVYAVARKDGEHIFTNENGTWRNLKGFDLYLRDLVGNKSVLISSEKYPLWIEESPAIDYHFGWLTNDKIFYSCRGDKDPYGPDYCFMDIKTSGFELKEADPRTFDLPNEVVNAPMEKLQPQDMQNYERTSLSPSGKSQIVFMCKFRIYDGCGVRTISVRHNEEDTFLYNVDETPYIVRWGYDDRLYGLLYIDGKTHVYRLF